MFPPPRRLSTSSLPPPVARSTSTDSGGSEFGRQGSGVSWKRENQRRPPLLLLLLRQLLLLWIGLLSHCRKMKVVTTPKFRVGLQGELAAGSKGPADWSGGGGGGVVAGHTVRRPVPRRQHSLPETQEQQLQRSIMELQDLLVSHPFEQYVKIESTETHRFHANLSQST
ncbi:hypothetical protein HPB51_024442 [Rhipicephalus microplus]|uniref:Uncharacterized protein n=1 Tax=Rhipicephalus microplus TaxID=6941 RepID=A0A9J6D7K1_RHIMP|nr:hypothetical protein HPB51_024442 [Rhipicephalus microplus]